jgi:RNA polymerase sigma-70 factor (ECF subfamily)
MLFGVERLVNADTPCGADAGFFRDVLATAPRVEARCHRGSWLLLHWYAHQDGEAVRAVTRVDAEGDQVACLHNYFYNPEFIAEVCAELGLASRSNGYRWWLPRP